MARTGGARPGPAASSAVPLRAVLAEAVGTAMLVLVGCGAILLDERGVVALGAPGVAAAFGLVVALMVAWLGPVSGAHINPAVTLALWTRGRVDAGTVLRYLPAQTTGALVAALALWAASPSSSLGATRFATSLPAASGWVMEAVATALLAFVILFVATGPRMHRIVAPLAIGGTVALAALVIGPFTGASLNPARSFGPALLAGEVTGLVPFLVAPVFGAAGGAWLACRVLPQGRCCAPSLAADHPTREPMEAAA